mmetsp:Transcript_39495/g.103590  ORF Transcript_39495/g.103590 Transcript_39495/m.103590 type:complete len:235 (-) Transcript_39495:565-1269(-)
MSKILEPIDDDTAMSPWPRLATAIDESASGIDVPAARRVRPITASPLPEPSDGLSVILPNSVTIQTMKKASNAIHAMHAKKVPSHIFSNMGRRQSGIVSHMAIASGSPMAQMNLPNASSGTSNGLAGSFSSSSSSSSSGGATFSWFSSLTSFFLVDVSPDGATFSAPLLTTALYTRRTIRKTRTMRAARIKRSNRRMRTPLTRPSASSLYAVRINSITVRSTREPSKPLTGLRQ